MLVVAIMLGCALYSIGYMTDPQFLIPSVPAQCLYHRKVLEEDKFPSMASYNILYVAVTMAFLGSAYLTRIILLFQGASEALRKFLRIWPSEISKRVLAKLRHQRSANSRTFIPKASCTVLYTVAMSLYCLMKAAADFYTSTLWEARDRKY